MRWPWTKLKPLDIPPYVPPVIEPKPKEPPPILVEEVDTTDLSATGIHRAWRRMVDKKE